MFQECDDNNSRNSADTTTQHINFFGSGQRIARLAGCGVHEVSSVTAGTLCSVMENGHCKLESILHKSNRKTIFFFYSTKWWRKIARWERWSGRVCVSECPLFRQMLIKQRQARLRGWEANPSITAQPIHFHLRKLSVTWGGAAMARLSPERESEWRGEGEIEQEGRRKKNDLVCWKETSCHFLLLESLLCGCREHYWIRCLMHAAALGWCLLS